MVHKKTLAKIEQYYKLKTSPKSYTKRGIKELRNCRIEELLFKIPKSLNS